MPATTYDTWVEDINKKYSEYSKQRVAGGFCEWFNRCVSNNNNLRKELEELEKHNSRIRTLEVSLMMASVAKVFDEELYDEGKHTAKSRDGSGKQTRYSSGAFRQAIKLAWENDALQIAIPQDKDRSTYYWVEVASALQKRFGLFKNLDELNKFVFTVGDMSHPKGIQNYGFYVRDLNELCLGYSILHGYSLKQYKSLYEKCNEIKPVHVFTEKKATRTEEAKSYFNNDLSVDILSLNDDELQQREDEFIEHVHKHNDVFLTTNIYGEKFSHWTALKKHLLDFINVLTSATRQELRKKESEVEEDKTFQGRIGTLWQGLANILDIDLDNFSTKNEQYEKAQGKLFFEVKQQAAIALYLNEEEMSKIKIKNDNIMGYLLYRLGLPDFCVISETCDTLKSLDLDSFEYSYKTKQLNVEKQTKQLELDLKVGKIVNDYCESCKIKYEHGELSKLSREPFDIYIKEYLDIYYRELKEYNANQKKKNEEEKKKLTKPMPPIFDISQFDVQDECALRFQKDVKSFRSRVGKIFNIQREIDKQKSMLKTTQKNKERISKAIKSILDDALRCIFIISIIKDCRNQETQSVKTVLDTINRTLIEYGFRGIDSTESPSGGCVDNRERDIFDWVVAAAIEVEYAEQQSNERKVISGFDTIHKFLQDGLVMNNAETLA